jgi:hypothetical protein
MFAESLLVLLSVMMTSKWEYVWAKHDATARRRYSGRLNVGMQMETRGGFTLQGAGAPGNAASAKSDHFTRQVMQAGLRPCQAQRSFRAARSFAPRAARKSGMKFDIPSARHHSQESLMHDGVFQITG